jgi:hypothetical protein
MSPPPKWDGVERRRYALRKHAEDLPEERRRVHLTEEERDEIKDQILASIYEDIGRSVVKKLLWALGAVLVALSAWLAAKGYLKT